MSSLNLTDAWKDYTPPSPPDAAGQTAADTPPAAPAPGARTSFFLSPETTGLLAPGNIDLRSRPVIHNPDGTVSTPRTLSIARDGRQYLIPTVSDEGELLSDQDAITRFEQTGRHLGAFKTLQDATGYANQLHRQQEILYAASPEDFQGREIQNRPPVSGFPGQAATPLSLARLRTLFDQPLTTPLIPSSTRPAPAFQPDPQRLEQLHALILHSKQDPELDALLETNPAFRAQADLDDGSLPSRALLGQQILREIAGDKYAGEPGFYFLALKEKLPEAATRQEAYAAVYDHYAKAIEKQYQENKTRKAAYQKNRTEVEGAVAKVIGSLWTPADLNTRLTPEQIDVYRKEFDTAAVEKAHAAFSILKQAFSATPEEGLRRIVSERTAMQITSALSDNDGTGKLTISETAFGLFEGALHTLMEETKEQTGDQYKFLHNLRLALFSPVIKRDATLGTLLQINSQQNNLIPFAHEHNDKVLEKTEETLRDYQTYLKNDKENARVLGLLSTGQDLGNSPNERAPFAARTVNCLGSVCGQTAPFFLPYAGWGLALAGAYDDKRNRAYYAGLAPGTAEWSAFIDAAASTAVEKISYGALGRLSGAGWLMGKLPFMGRTRKALTDSLWKHVLFETGAGIVEETFIEPTAEAVIQWAVRGGIAPLAGINAGADYDWNNYWQELKGMLEPDQLLATALFVGGLAGGVTGTNSLIMQRSLITYSRSPEMLMSQGIPEAEAKRIAQIPDNGERIAAVRNAVARLKTRPPAEVLKKAKEGVKAFQSLAEIRATVESEAYQYFQSAMHLPLVEEKLDKPGTYAVTIFDPHSGQKKFTQEMTGVQLTAHFGQYLKSEQRAIIAQAQSDFAANAFMRTSEAHGAIQTQDMLQWSRQDQENAPKEPESATKKPEDKKDSPAPTQASDNPPAPQTAPAQTPPASDTVQEASPPSTATDTPASTATDSPLATAHTDSPAPSENLSVLGRFIRTFGSMGQTGFSYLTRVALEEWNRRLSSGLSREQAAAAPFAPLSPYAPLGTMLGLEEAFKKRLKIAEKTTGEEGSDQTRLFQMRTAPGTTPADILFLVSKGLVGTSEMLEDLFEVGIKNLVKGEPARLEAMGALLRDTQAGLQKLGFQGQFIAPSGPLDGMKVVEAMSKLALSDTLVNAESLPLPQWQKDLLQYHVNYLQDAAWLLDLGHAWNLGREKGTITRDMADILRDLGHIVHTMYDQAKIEQQDIQAVMEARTLTGRLDASGIPAASEIRERQQKDAEEEKTRTTTGDRSKERPLPQTALQRPETLTLPEAPDTMKGVFVNGASYNPDAGTWLGMVPVDKLHLSPQVPQVKVNSGKKGVVNPLVGDYRADAPPIYVWKRTTGRLEVVSGRHRLDLAQRTGIKAIPAYVYEEDATHNAQWARLLDYEQNMQDDQADELTAAIYVRETSLTDDELTRRGLTRSGTRSRRGLLIGREAREDLWTRFRSGAITAQNAEAICLLTRHIQDKVRIDAMQTTAANDLANGKTLEFIAAKLQLMAHASADGGMVQGLITFGDTFESDMEKAAEYVSRCITTINDHINAIKGVRTISKKDSVLATEGITAGLSADPAERLRELELLKAMYEKIGLYENLRIRALAWDGKTPPDPIGDHRLDMQAERARAEEDAAALENEETRKVSEALIPKLTFSLTPSLPPSRDLGTAFPALWRQAARELNATGQVSFALAGSRVAIHTLSEIKMQRALELGGMPNPAIQIADLDSGPTNYGEIACILHPERIDPARTPGARIFRGDAWTRQMPEKISEDGDLWEGYEHSPEETPWFYDTEDNLLEWNRENLDAYMKAKHLDSFMPHNMTPDEVLDNYGEDGGAFPIIMASQAYAAEFPSLEEAMRTDNLTLQLDRREAETAVRELEQQFKTLLDSCYIESRSLQKFLIGYWWRDISHENVRNALIGEELLDDPDMLYDQEENPEEYNDLQNSNDDIAEEVRTFLDACRTSTKIYYEAAPGGWLFPSDFSGFILPSSLESTLGPELEKYGVPIRTYHLTAEEALALGNPWALGKAPWFQEAVDERRNEAIREFLEDRDVSFSLTGGEEEDRPSPPLDFPSPSSDFPLALSPSRLASSFHAVEKEPPLSISIPQATEADKQGYSKLARKAFISLRTKTRQKDSLPRQSIRRQEELVKPFLSTADSRVIFLGEKDWSRFISSSPDTRTLAVMSALEELIVTARYMYSVPEFDANAPDQTKARHYYLGKVKDNVHGTSLVLLTFREDTRGTYLETLETEKTDSSGNKNGSVSSLTDFGLTHRAARRSLPAPTLHALKQFVNFIDEQGEEKSVFYAPNGQPSRLTPDQWHLVRTAPFLRYFGDWLHDPSSSSVVLDANGEPLVCYRGLKQSYNPGVRRNYTWVSTSRDLSEQYAAGGAVLDLFISARRPFHFPDGLTRQSPVRFRETIKKELEQDRQRGLITADQYSTAALRLDSLLQGTEETEAFKIWERHRNLKDILAPLGYDSVMTEENGVMTYGLFRPGQAKSAVGNCGTYDITLPDITFSLTPQEQRTTAQALVEDTFLRAPDGTPTALTERQWLQTNSAAFKKWFGQSKIVNSHGEPVIVYHGTRRADRVGTVFRPDRATSGPMAFFTDHENIASNYARDKADTSIAYEEENYYDYRQQFRVTLLSGRDIPLINYWRLLPAAEQARITRTAGHIREDDEGEAIILDPSTDQANGSFQDHLHRAGGNTLRALVYHWLESGILYNQEYRFLQVLEKLDLPLAPSYRDPDYREPKVYACYMRMETPFRTARLTRKIITSFKAAAKKAGASRQGWRTDTNDKNQIPPQDWIDRLEQDYADHTTTSWASIPDWVTACLKRQGYDGIIDQGGKFHPEEHTVCIPFSSGQLKSATDNNGAFDPGNPDITFSLSPEERLITKRAKADGSWMKAPNGQPSRLEPGLWARVRTKSFMDWFGDWLHQPEQASRVVDANGEPLIVYHGSRRAGFTVFDADQAGKLSQFGTPEGIYFFSDNRRIAASYSQTAAEAELPSSALSSPQNAFPAIYSCFLNIRDMREEDFAGKFWDGRNAEEESGYGETPTTNTIALEASEQGYDGALIRNVIDMGDNAASFLPSSVYAVFQPEQIKSAMHNRGTFAPASPDITFSIASEKRLITLRAKKDGTWLKAPNGKPSRLEPGLWAAVRTKSFMSWFGDWINAPSEASRVVDDNGEPQVIYHGSNYKFTEFDPSFAGDNYNRQDLDFGFLFATTDEYEAQHAAKTARESVNERRYARGEKLFGEKSPRQYALFANLRNPLIYDLAAHPVKLPFQLTGTEPDVWDSPRFALQAQQEFREGDDDGKDYDGIILKGKKSSWILARQSPQLKSAKDNRGTYDAADPDITFSLWDEDTYTTERAAIPLNTEERSIIARARDRGDYMLAPGGQPTLLTEKQWAQVRTKAFLSWFGDWLHDPANASKTLDENGEPLNLFHGGRFDINHPLASFDDGPGENGIFFSDSPELAEYYRGGYYITTAWLNLKNPFRAQDEASSRLPWVDEYIDYWQEEEGWTDRHSGEAMDREAVRDIIREGDLYNYDSTGNRWRDFLDWIREHHDGYLGHDPTDMGALVAVAFNSNQVKSSEYNSGAFSAAHRDITFSLSSLAAVHSLNVEKFLAADQLGGLPLPSLAVTRLDKPYTWDGEDNIYLIGSPALADPARGVEIHDRDAWSGHFPQLRWNIKEQEERQDFYRRAQQAALQYYGSESVAQLRFLKNALDGDHRDALEDKLRRNVFSLALFAAEHGYAPRPKKTKTPARFSFEDRQFYREILKMLPWPDSVTLAPDRQQDFQAAMERAIERFRQTSTAPKEEKESHIRRMEEELKFAQENFTSASARALQDARFAGKTVPDWEANSGRFAAYAAKHRKTFDAWVQDKMTRWVTPRPRIRETGFPATLDNITRYMLGSKHAGAEKGIVFSTGLLRAKQSRRFDTLEQIKNNRDILVTTEENKTSQQEAQALIHEFQAALDRIVRHPSAYDNAVEALSFVRGAPTPQKVLSGLARFYRGTPHMESMEENGSLLELGAEALTALKTELRDYFEAVPQRAVKLEEFSRAILPAALKKNKQIQDVLKRRHIRPLYHDGTQQGRFQAMASLMGSSMSFSLTSGPSWLRFPTSEDMASLSEEERPIVQKALSTGTWLKAPNGENSRLTPRQWAQVRTAAFKNWFGDWQADPAHASRIIDENGEPRIVYHGTKHAGFTIFDRGKGISSPDTPADSSFFAADPEVAASYSETQQEVNLRSPLADTRSPGIYPCFLNLRAPLEEDFEGLWWYEKGEPWFDLYDKQSASYINPPDGKLYWTSRQEGIDYAAARGLTDYMLIRIYSSRTVHTVVQEAADAGADGAVIHNVIDGGDKETDIYVSLHPEQIKSATDNIGTFDPASPDITFSVIGPHAATWEQYKKKTFRGRDDGMYRAELDSSQAVLKDRAAPYLAPLRRELAALRRTLPAETKKQITRYLSLHRQFHKNKRKLNPEKNVAKWFEYLALDREEERWCNLLANAILRSGVCRTSPLSASALAAWTSSLTLLLKEDEVQTAALAARAADKTPMTLEEWLDYPELFAAYPALRTMPVILDFFRDYLGLYFPQERTIYLHQNLDDPQQIRSVLLHEIQHAIQHIEGFAKGGTEESARNFYQIQEKEAREAYEQSAQFVNWLNARDDMISTLEYMLSLARNPRRVLRTSYHHSYDGITRRLEGEERLLDMTRYALEDQAGMLEQFYMENWNTDPQFDLPWPGNYHLNTPSGIQDCLTAARATPSRRLAYRSTPKPDMTTLSRNLFKYERLSGHSSYELYRRLAGEIESRNVQSRWDWAAERRTTEPFNATLEYPGESLVSFSMTRAENRPAESFLSTLTEEERTLADTAWESGAWLLAPGGQPTRLTPRQWLQVRTAAFKAWFGDWEHDPLEASCVVDDHREPLVVYHGARHAGFSVFDNSEGVSHSEAPAGAAFFTDNLSVALSYSGTREEPDLLDPSSLEGVYSPPGLYPCFLNLREPWDMDFEGANWDGTGQLLFEFYDNETEDFIYPPNGGDFWKSEESIREYAEANSYTDYEIYNVEGHRTTNTIVQDAINMGLDGAVIYNVIDMGSYAKGAEKTSDIYVAFRPEQIKSATQNRGTFDPRHPDITFSLAASLAVQQSITSADTSIRQVARTFGIVRDKLGGWEKGSVNIDIGGGKYDDFTQALEREGVTSYLYDPFARHAAHNAPVLRDLRRGRLKGDTVTCSNVLNVIPEQSARFNVIHQAAKSLKPDGTAWFCVYEGDGTGTGRVTRTRSGMASCWQENRKTASYLEEIRPFFGEVELRHGLIRARAPRRTESPASWRLGRDTEGHASFSLSSLREQSRFTQGMFPVRNALITEPGASFSLAAEHASPYSFRKFKENGEKEEKKTLNYGWGLYFTEDPLKSRAYEKSFRSADDAKEIFYLIDGEKSPASAFLPDEQDMLDEISANGWDNISSYVNRNREVMELYSVYRAALDKYRGKTVERIWESLPSSAVSSYQVELNVKEEDLLTWEDHVPSALLDKVIAYIKAPHPDFHSEIMNYPAPANGSGRHVPVKFLCPRLQECLGKKEASKWLLSQGIKGLRYYNGERIPGKKYDYVIFDENDIKITAVRDASTHWKDFTPYHDPSASFSVIGPHAATWEQYRERSFTGRDDGKMRAELDASQASLLLDRPERDTAPLLSLLETFKTSSPDSALIGSPRMKLYRDVLETETYARNNGISREEENDIYRELLKEYGFDEAAALTAPDSLSSAIRELTVPCRRIHEKLWDMLKNNPLTRGSLPDSAPFSAASLNVSEGVFNFLVTGESRHILKALPDAGEWKTYRLGDILSYPELFAAYPSLEDIRITFQNKLPEGASGAFYQRSNTIALRAPSPYAPPSLLLSTLLHELQHVIQTMEDYARGGGPSLGTRLYFLPAEEKLHALKAYDYSLSHGFDHLRQAYEIAQTGGAPAEDTELYRQILWEDDTMTAEEKHRFIARLLEDELEQTRYRFSSDMPENTPPSLRFPVEQITLPPAEEALTDRGQSIQQALTLAESLHAPIRAALRETEHHYRELLDNFEKKGGAPGAYLSLAGEIEARNVQHRMYKRAQVRAAEPFNSTLEYPGEALVSFAIAPGSPDAAFSLTSLHQIVSTLTAPSLQATRAAALVKDFDKAAENWKRVMSGKQDRPSARIGAELFGTINALLSSARYVLPPGYRSQVDMQMQWASIYAAMAESGEIPPKGTLRTGEVFYENFERSMINQTTTAATEQEVRETLAAIGDQRLDHVMSKILDRVRGQLIYFAKDELFRKTMKREEAVYPKKEPGRKSPRGRMEARAYRTLARCRQMLAANAQEKAEAMTALEALYNKEEDEDKQQEYEQDLLAWKTYGDYKGMSLPQAQEAMKKLLEFLLAGRNSWDHKLKKERGGAKFQARQIQKNLPEANSTSTRAGAKIEHHTKLRKLLASLPYSFMSYAQLMLALEPILGQRFSRARIREITEANSALLNASNDRSAWLFKTIARITGVKTESAAEQWMVRFNKPENTKIPLAPLLTVKITLPIEEAQAWLSLTREERDARRQEIRAEDQRTETLTENVPEEEDILHLRMALDEYERRSPARRQYQQNITSQREVPNKAGSGPLICSRDCALYALLLHEQPDYADVYDDEGVLIRKGFLRREGLDDAGIAALYDYVGPDGLEYGYALRKRLNETGQTLAQIYEQRMGVPFTLKEKYFRATFDRNSTKEKDTLAEPRTGAIGGGKYGLLIDRVVHSENLDLSKSGTLVFLAAAAEQDNYIYTSHITTAWRALLKDKILEQKLKQRLGEDMLGKLSSWMDLIDGASLENNRAFLNLSRMQGMLQRAFAFSVLAGNGYVLLKQSTAILHGFFAGWVPSAVLERADGARELAHRHISASSYLFHLAASKLGLGDISMREVAETPYFTARMRGEGAMLAQIGNQMPGQRYSRLEKLPEKAMDLIETVDVKANLLAMHALANAYYAHARALNEANDTPFTDAELRTATLQQVGMSLELGAQPLTKTQKSMNQAAGGILSKLAFIMKSEQLNKIGLMAAEWKTGSTRNRVCAAQSWLALGVTSSLLAWLIAWIKGMDDDDDKEKKWKKYAATALLGDLTTIPLAGEGVNYLASLITGERVFADSYARSLIDVQGVARTVKKEYEHVSDKKEMDWDTHFNNLTSLARAAGVGGAFSRSPSAVLSSYGALSLSAATGANISRTAKDLLTTLFRNEDEDRKKKKRSASARKAGTNNLPD